MTSFPRSSGVAATSVPRSSSTWIWKSSSTPVTSRSGAVPDFSADKHVVGAEERRVAHLVR